MGEARIAAQEKGDILAIEKILDKLEAGELAEEAKVRKLKGEWADAIGAGNKDKAASLKSQIASILAEEKSELAEIAALKKALVAQESVELAEETKLAALTTT